MIYLKWNSKKLQGGKKKYPNKWSQYVRGLDVQECTKEATYIYCRNFIILKN